MNFCNARRGDTKRLDSKVAVVKNRERPGVERIGRHEIAAPSIIIDEVSSAPFLPHCPRGPSMTIDKYLESSDTLSP